MKAFFDNISEAPRKAKARDFTFYLDEIKKMGCEFEKLEAFCTDGDIRPPYPYQWRATTKYRVGEDDPHEGIGDTPIKAIYEMYKSVKEESKSGTPFRAQYLQNVAGTSQFKQFKQDLEDIMNMNIHTTKKTKN
jgi:hypothetical protein